MNNNSENKLGIWGAPGTFPTQKVQAEIYTNINQLWERDKINQLYFVYKDAVLKHGLKSWPDGGSQLVYHIATVSGYPINDIRIFLMNLIYLNEKYNDYFKKFLTIELQQESPPVLENALQAAAAPGGLTRTLKDVKVIGILVLVGIGIYFTWPLLTGARRRLARG